VPLLVKRGVEGSPGYASARCRSRVEAAWATLGKRSPAPAESSAVECGASFAFSDAGAREVVLALKKPSARFAVSTVKVPSTRPGSRPEALELRIDVLHFIMRPADARVGAIGSRRSRHACLPCGTAHRGQRPVSEGASTCPGFEAECLRGRLNLRDVGASWAGPACVEARIKYSAARPDEPSSPVFAKP